MPKVIWKNFCHKKATLTFLTLMRFRLKFLDNTAPYWMYVVLARLCLKGLSNLNCKLPFESYLQKFKLIENNVCIFSSFSLFSSFQYPSSQNHVVFVMFFNDVIKQCYQIVVHFKTHKADAMS